MFEWEVKKSHQEHEMKKYDYHKT